MLLKCKRHENGNLPTPAEYKARDEAQAAMKAARANGQPVPVTVKKSRARKG